MSTVHGLLSMLHESGQRSPTSARHLLLELASCCRCEDAKAAIVADGLEPLLALAADDHELPRGETLEVLLELLVLLLLDNPQAKANAAKGGALELAVRCLHELSAAGGGRRRAKILKRALELVDLLSHTSESQQQEKQVIILKQVLEIMERTDEDVSVLVRATDTLGRFVDGSLERIQIAANERSILVLIELLKLNDDKVDLKRTAFEVLMLMGEASGMLQMMATYNIVSALNFCLSMEPPAREVEVSVVRLLFRLARETRIYGEIVHEEMVPLLFRVIERNSNSREVTATTCTIIADLSDFARECKLDMSPFVDDCRGKVLVLAATCHAQEANVVDCTFRFFVNVSNNPVDLPQLINSETIEGLLSLYVLAGGSGYLAELAGHLVHVISRLSRATLEQFTIQEEDITLPALFLCLRNYHEDIRFSSQVFAIMAKHWKMQCQNKSVHGITGYVGIAIEVLCRTIPSSKSWGDKTVDIINFIREMLLSREGADVVLSCGGKDLLEVLHTCLPVRDDSSSSNTGIPSDAGTEVTNLSSRLSVGERIAFVLVNMLEKTVLGLTDLGVITDISSSEPSTNCQQPPSLRFGDAEYNTYVSGLFHLENSCHFKPIEGGMASEDTSNSTHENALVNLVEEASAKMSQAEMYNDQTIEYESDSEHANLTVPADSNKEDDEGFNTNGEVNAENAEDENNDDSDDDDDDEVIGTAGGLREMNGVNDACSFASSETQSPVERENPLSSTFEYLQDMQWYYVDSSDVKHPKHPARRNQEDQNNSEEEFVLNEPDLLEPCNLPGPETSARFVDEAVARRAEFMANDVDTRARTVYENLSMVEDCGEKVTGVPLFLLNCSATQHDTPYFVPEKTMAFSDTTSLTFDSNFESGNLERAIRIGPYEYDLVLKHDFNSSGHMQWFYFAVSNIQIAGESPRGGQKYRFNIVNLCKPNSLFNQGLQPVVYSVRDARQEGKGWVRSGSDIYYFANSYMRPPRNVPNVSGAAPTEVMPPAAPTMTYYTLTFTLEFWNAEDTYLIAHSYPYTLTMHQLHIDSILNSGHDTRQVLRHSSLCTTLSGRDCDLLTISDFSVSQKELNIRKAVFISSRVHPGEAQASWMMRGVIDFLLGNSDIARVLRRMFVFQIIPMLNPDGVFYGNSRCGLAACDLNRQWQTPSKALHPTIFYAKELLVKERSTRGVVFFCDMHGHSRKKNIFMYGCDTKRKPNPAARAFAKLFSTQQTAKKYISLPDCSFKVSRDKETTARVVVASELKINWSFTLEASFCGANYGELQNMHFNTRHLREAGAALCETLFQACISDSDVRDRLIGLVHDATVCFPQRIEPHLREAGAITDNLVDEDSNAIPRSSLVKGKYGSGLPPKSVRRKLSKARALGASESKLLETTESSGRRRRLSQQSKKSSSVGSGLLDGVSRDVPVFVSTDDSTTCLDLAYIPPPKLTGRKLRSKYPKVRKTKSSPEGHVKSRRRAIPSLSSSDTADKIEEPHNQVATTVGGIGGNYPSNDSIMPLVSPSKLPATVPGPSTLSVRGSLSGFQVPESAYVRSPKSISFLYPGNVLGIQLRDSSALLPSPVGELVTRSPKAPANRIRFRGAGRQFSAVNVIPRTSIHDILRSDSVTAFQSYEADLINASTMVIRQRGNVSSSNNATAAADEKSLPPPSSTYLSFPSVI